MTGYEVLYLPGTDHAGISTQIVVEKKLLREEGLTKHDVGREELIRRILDWKQEFGERICGQLKRLGGSLDWTRLRFTLDENMTNAVESAFVKLFEEGVVYRDKKLVNWSVKLNTTLSNLEVEQLEIEGQTKLAVPGYERLVEFGVLHEFAYLLVPLECKEEERIVVATTRIETMLADAATAMHPLDPRYTHLHGRS